MNKKTKRTEKIKEKDKEEKEIGSQDSPSRDQKEKRYYYDDAHGYEIYNPETIDDETDES